MTNPMHLLSMPRLVGFVALFTTVVVVAISGGAARTNPSSGWIDERHSGPFVCRANFPLTGYEGLFRELSQVQTDLIYSLGIEATREPVELYFFHDKKTYQDFMRARYPQVPVRPALFIKGRGPGRVYVYRRDELAIDVRHESTHALLHAALPMVPLWLDEGLAEYFEVPAAERETRKAYLDKLKWAMRFGRIPRLTSLESKRDISEMSDADYRHAWAWVHFMLHGPPEARDELVRFLADIRASTPPGALSQRLERRLPGVEKRLAHHMKTWKPAYPGSAPQPVGTTADTRAVKAPLFRR